MKLLAYEVDKRSFLGIFNEDETWVYPISAAGMEYRSMKDLIREAGPSEMEMLDYISKKAPGDVTGAAPVEEIKIVSPIPEPDQDIICLGINYMDHARNLRGSRKRSLRDLRRQSISPSASTGRMIRTGSFRHIKI